MTKILITLDAEDRARLGCPDVLVYDRAAVTIRDLLAIQRATGIVATHFSRAVSEGDGDAIVGMVWLALRQVGITTELDKLDFHLYGMTVETEGEPEPGKDQSPQTPTSDG